MNRELLEINYYTDLNNLEWLCPTCNKGKLKLNINKYPILEAITAESLLYRNDADPDLIDNRFSTILICDNNDCQESVSISGIMNYHIYEGGQNDLEFHSEENHFNIKYVNPPFNIINIPKNIPDYLKSELKKVFMLYWIEYSSCASYIRKILEQLMDNLKVQKLIQDKNGKWVNIHLHNRIKDYFGKKYKELSELLLSIKWIGNDGSHKNVIINKNDIINVLELLEYCLEEIYDKKSERLKIISKKIIKKHS